MTVPWVRPELCVLRGGGDLATGVAWRLTRAGWPVVVCELPAPLTVRRQVAVSTAVLDGEVTVEGMRAVRVEQVDNAPAVARNGVVAVVVAPMLPPLNADVVVDARLAKRNLDTQIHDAPMVVALGPGFVAGIDCHAVVETKRGPHLGRVLWSGAATPDTGTPGVVEGRGAVRVLRAPVAGRARWHNAIGDLVTAGAVLGEVDGVPVKAPFDGTVRGLISEAVQLTPGLKIGDVDPRSTGVAADEISDKALAVGGGVVEAIHAWLRQTVAGHD